MSAVVSTEHGERRTFSGPFLMTGAAGRLVCVSDAGEPSARVEYTSATIHTDERLPVEGVRFESRRD